MTSNQIKILNYARYCVRYMDNKKIIEESFPNVLKMKISNMVMDEDLDSMIDSLTIIVTPEKKSISINFPGEIVEINEAPPEKKKIMF